MQVNQIYDVVNKATEQYVGESVVLKEDLTNVVDFGVALFKNTDVDNYVKSLVDVIGRVVFVDNVYKSRAPDVSMNAWEYGSVMQKIEAELPEAVINESWALVDKKSYDQDIFNKPKVSNKFFNNKLAFDIDVSFTDKQIKSSFHNANNLNAFISMIVTSINNSMTIKVDSLIMRTINSMISSTVFDGYGTVVAAADYGKKSTSKAVNLLKLFNSAKGTSLTAAKCLSDSEFLKFACYNIELYKHRLGVMSTLFNVGKTEKFTSVENLKTVLLSEYKLSVDSMLLSSVYNESYIKNTYTDVVSFWQGSGLNYDFQDTSAINVDVSGHSTNLTGIIAIVFDKTSCAVCNSDYRVTTHHNARAEFYNNFYKFESSYFSDLNENFVVFFVHD